MNNNRVALNNLLFGKTVTIFLHGEENASLSDCTVEEYDDFALIVKDEFPGQRHIVPWTSVSEIILPEEKGSVESENRQKGK